MEPNKQRSNWMIVLVCVLLIGLLVAGSVLTGGEQGEKQLLETVERQSGGGSASVEKNPSGSAHLRDNDELYTVYDDSGVVTMYLTVSRETMRKIPTTAGARSTIIPFMITRPWACRATR